jgi:hypothetical protein
MERQNSLNPRSQFWSTFTLGVGENCSSRSPGSTCPRGCKNREISAIRPFLTFGVGRLSRPWEMQALQRWEPSARRAYLRPAALRRIARSHQGLYAVGGTGVRMEIGRRGVAQKGPLGTTNAGPMRTANRSTRSKYPVAFPTYSVA